MGKSTLHISTTAHFQRCQNYLFFKKRNCLPFFYSITIRWSRERRDMTPCNFMLHGGMLSTNVSDEPNVCPCRAQETALWKPTTFLASNAPDAGRCDFRLLTGQNCHQEVVIGIEGCGTDGVVVPGSLGGCTRIDMYRWSRQAPTDTIECWKLPVAIYAPDIAYRRENNLTAKNRRAWQVIRHTAFFAVKGSFPNTPCTRSEPHTRTHGVKTSDRS